MPYHHHAHAPYPASRGRPTLEWPDVEPPPNVPTLEEIEIADELRHDLELKYLGKADPCWDSSSAHSRRRTDENS